jgi:epidermal growth factor receptor substrate 15
VPGASVFNLLVTSDVPQATLGEIWALADPEDKGHLDAKGWTMAMRLIAVAQRGGDITREAGDARE